MRLNGGILKGEKTMRRIVALLCSLVLVCSLAVAEVKWKERAVHRFH